MGTNYIRVPESAWDGLCDGTHVHLGKRSSGWKFLWNFHNNKYYSNKKELLSFIRSGRVVNEYDELLDSEEFIKMALEWGEPNGIVFNEIYELEQRKIDPNYYSLGKNHHDLEIDGLIVAQCTEFS